MPITNEEYRVAIGITHLPGNIFELTDSQKRKVFPSVLMSVVLVNNPYFNFGFDTVPEILRDIAGDPRSREFQSDYNLTTYSEHSRISLHVVRAYDNYVIEYNEPFQQEIQRARVRRELGYISDSNEREIILAVKSRRLPKIKFASNQVQFRFLGVAQLLISQHKARAQKGILTGATPTFNEYTRWMNTQEGQKASAFLNKLKPIACIVPDDE